MTSINASPLLWAGFILVILVLLTIDLVVVHRKDEVISTRAAIRWTFAWIGLALLFDGWIWWRYGSGKALEFITGYLIEESLSVDNLFVFILLFNAFAVPVIFQHRVLFWGILTAIVLRAGMILGGAALIARFDWLIYVFGAFLLVTGVRLALKREKDEEPHPEKSWAFRTLRRIVPSTSSYHGHAFFVREGARWVATPLFLALAMIELSDVVFALDSIPAIFGVTLDPFIVFTSNIFAILGLRSLFFAVARMMDRFAYLEYGLAAVLVFIGGKMLASSWIHVPALASLGVVLLLLGGAIGISIFGSRRDIPEGEAIVKAKKD
ncbi:MAG: TerC family protein [Anaeromyxobacteraceae bacterium]